MSDDIYEGAIPDPVEYSGEMLSVTSLLEDMMLFLPGCTDMMARKELAYAYRDFCSRTASLDKRETTEDLDKDHTVFVLSSNLGTVGLVKEARVDGRPIPISTVHNNCGCVGVDFRGRINDDGKKHEYSVIFSVTPKIGCEIAPAWFLNRYGNAIISCALYRLQSMMKKPWSDPQQAQQHALEYNKELDNATIDRLTFIHKGDINARSPLPWIV